MSRLRTHVRPAPHRTEVALRALFWVPLGIAALALILWPPHTVDGPAHLLGANVLAERIDLLDPYEGGDPFGVYADFYEIDLFPTPNLAGTLLLAAAVELGSLRFAETVVLLLAALATPLALRYAIRAVRPESAWLAIAALPLSFGYLYFYGFYNYCLGIALALICAGVILRAAPAWRPGPALAITGLLTLTWLTHLIPFVAAAVFLAAVALTGGRTRRGWLVPALALAPAAALSFAYLARNDAGAGPSWTGPVGRLVGMVSLHTPVTTFTRWEDVIAAALALVLAALAVRAIRAGGPASRGPVLAVVAMAVLVLITPTRFGIEFGLIDERLAVFPVLFALIALAARPPPPQVALAAASAFVLVAGALALVRLEDLRRYDRLADEYAAAAAFVQPHSVLLALRFHAYPSDAGRNDAWDPTRHLSSGVAAATDSVDIGHYEAVLDYFPTRFRADADLRRLIDPDLTGLARVPPEVDLRQLRALPASAAGRFYVLLVGAPAATGDAARALTDTRAILAADYVRVGVTAPRGLVEVWRAR